MTDKLYTLNEVLKKFLPHLYEKKQKTGHPVLCKCKKCKSEWEKKDDQME